MLEALRIVHELRRAGGVEGAEVADEWRRLCRWVEAESKADVRVGLRKWVGRRGVAVSYIAVQRRAGRGAATGRSRLLRSSVIHCSCVVRGARCVGVCGCVFARVARGRSTEHAVRECSVFRNANPGKVDSGISLTLWRSETKSRDGLEMGRGGCAGRTI